MLANKELQAIATAIGVDPHGLDDEVRPVGLRYGKVVVMTDADVDGGHIQALLLTFFFMHAPKLVETGRIYVAQPPLFKVEVPAQGKGKPARRLYCLDDDELEEALDPAEEGKGEGRQLGDLALQGPGRDEPGAALGDDHEPDTRRLVRMRLDRADSRKCARPSSC